MPMSKELRIQMLRRGVTQQSIARSLGVTKEAVYQEFSGRRVSKKVRAAIIEAVGWSERRIWPDAGRSKSGTTSPSGAVVPVSGGNAHEGTSASAAAQVEQGRGAA